MNALFDANVWLSAQISPKGVCRRVIDAAVAAGYSPVVCPSLLADVREKPCGKFKWNAEEAEHAVREIEGISSAKPEPENPPAVCRDPDDDALLAVAMEWDCAFIISGDGDLKVLGQYEGVRIISPRTFADILSVT